MPRTDGGLSRDLGDEIGTWTLEDYWRQRRKQAEREGRCECWAAGRACECQPEVEG